MCGIAGFQGPWEPELAGWMEEALAHRGPDGAGTAAWDEGRGVRTALAHRRLSIIDLSDEGLQPMTVECDRCGCHGLGDLALTFNGEIYNFRELRDQLRTRGHAFHSGTDSEVLLHLYADEGPAMLSRLNGIFAFAIRDGRERGRPAGVERGDLFVARDQLGIKPLYFAALPDGYLFASEIKSILRCPDVPRELDAAALHQQLAYLWTPAPRTMLQSVRKLPPGEAQLVRRGRVARQWRYYDLPYGGERLAGSEDEIAARVRAAVATAVERQLVADVPVGAFLSGGLDSSAVVAMMKQARPDDRPTTYCIGFGDGEDADGNPADLPYAEKVAAHLGVKLHALRVDPSIIGNLERMLWLLDEPQADPAPINALLIAEQARRDGFKVLLSGAGGDDIFSGYRRHRALRLERMWTRFPAPVRALMGATVRRGAGPLSASPWARRAVKLVEHAHLDDDRRMAAYFWWSGEGLRRGLYSPELAARTAGEDTAAPLLESLSRIPDERDPLNRMLYLEGKHFLADHNLNYTDKMGMAAGVEVRVPLLDPDLVALAARIPPGMKQKGAEGKAIFKKAMEPLLPRDVIYRPKSGFGAPLRQWLKGELRGHVEDTLSPQALRSRGLFDPAAVRRLVEADRAGRVDGAYTILALMCVEIWCRLFVDAPAPQPVGAA
ncbi:asparagine synthase (glutamine-hydrolyzing) [Longimicrobium sp.]|uniref:asparagine synthase (glutamine-hydrolyzing) n=1 Tax=Longimicrobium sp. TaxID=2029185 RepID=UPI002E2FD7F0|nr:asparagine synthase (glutamine-hydrolyzing) [Longimicrobium sp.]HEX6039517.1 asparagine synthase (glutamine-hydrolyzing) [Longimicrobium sp.]